jgi:two-component system response regulator (stage 0 sporulation protein F)
MQTDHRGRVLVAENDDDTRALIAELLLGEGREVVEVASGEELLEQALTRRTASSRPAEAFDVIVTEERMPGGTGLDMIERLRRAGCATPVLLITAFVDDHLRGRADDLETMVMVKPFPLPAFLAAVSVLLSLHPV